MHSVLTPDGRLREETLNDAFDRIFGVVEKKPLQELLKEADKQREEGLASM